MPEDRVRVLRVLEYVGSRTFVERSLERRTVKGRYYPSIDLRSGDYIQEAVLGETAEVLAPRATSTCECNPDQGCGAPSVEKDSNV